MMDIDPDTTPSTETTAFWLSEGRSDASDADLGGEPGKWMLFYPRPKLDAAWAAAKRLYRSNELPGVVCMKVSTARPNPRCRDTGDGVIICYCGPASAEEPMRRIGHALIRAMDYRENATVSYKSDLQTMGGTAATGQRVNHLYRIRVSDVLS
ncbi:hypothetical protein DIPPA_25020 [Diplonema papillatum]|nr:hypothetical protein DIPPA_25020 [Diplonema papillatum]